MCKPSCCPGNNRSGLPAAVAIVAALTVLSAVARPLIHAAELVFQAALITLGAVVTLTAVALVTILLNRARRVAIRPGPGQIITAPAAAVLRPPARTWAQAAIADRIRILGPAPGPGDWPAEVFNRSDSASDRCPAYGITPGRRDPDAS